MRARLLVSVLVSAIVALGLTAASASARKPALQAQTLTVQVKAGAVVPQQGPIEGLALDGTNAAFVKGVSIGRTCALGRRVYRWNLATGKTSPASGAKTCAVPDTSTGGGIVDIALTRTGSAWLVNSGGNSESGETLLSSTSKPHKDKVIATSDRHGNPDTGVGFAGTSIAGLVSDGSQIWYATWTTAADQTVTESALWRIANSTATQVASNSGAVVSASADRGRIALLRTDGSVAIYASDGTLLNTIAGAGRAGVDCSYGCGAPGEGVALTSKLVAVLTESRPNRQAGSINVYDRASGDLLYTWPSAGYRWQFDAYGGIAVYVNGRSIHALDLKTGTDVVVAKRRHAIQEVRLDKAGLLYYYNGAWSKKSGQKGTVAFVPFKTIAAKLGR